MGLHCFHVLSPLNAHMSTSQGPTVIQLARQHMKAVQSAVLCFDELDCFIEHNPQMASEIRQIIEGPSHVDSESVSYIIGTTNNPGALPPDLVHRVDLHVNFDSEDAFSIQQTKDSITGFDCAQCLEFWKRNAKHLNPEDREVLAGPTTGLRPRDLNKIARRVVMQKYFSLICVSDGKRYEPFLLELPAPYGLCAFHPMLCQNKSLQRINGQPCYESRCIVDGSTRLIRAYWGNKSKQWLLLCDPDNKNKDTKGDSFWSDVCNGDVDWRAPEVNANEAWRRFADSTRFPCLELPTVTDYTDVMASCFSIH